MFPEFDGTKCQDIQYKMFAYAYSFVSDADVLILTLLIDTQTMKIPNVNTLDRAITKNAETFNKLQDRDKELIHTCDETVKNIQIVFLSVYKCLFDLYEESEKKPPFSQEQIAYAMEILSEMDISILRDDLEDTFFAYTEADTFNHYSSLRNFSSMSYQHIEGQIRNEIEQQLKDNEIETSIAARLKSIWSIHKKILKKNILYSQVLDIIGLRIVVLDKADCYKVMEIILKKWSLQNNKIKDYISVPKRNGYQSIHITILYDGHPVEIQIRTESMHIQAQYGSASHHVYKNKEIVIK